MNTKFDYMKPTELAMWYVLHQRHGDAREAACTIAILAALVGPTDARAMVEQAIKWLD